MAESGNDITRSRNTTLHGGLKDGRAPDRGPRILFFSGGTALRRLSRKLVNHSHRSVHVITPFDSGGSSAVLRQAFGMPAVGDLRNRLMALADGSVKGNPELYRLAAYRFGRSAPRQDLWAELDDMVAARHPLVARVPQPLRETFCRYLGFFAERAGETFDLAGASIGNLVLAGGYFSHGRRLEPVLDLFSRLVGARGTVRPVIDADLHLVADLEDGTRVLGQHRITGKECPPITSPVRDLWLTADLSDPVPADACISPDMSELIAGADLVCYPMGSFFTSLVANLLPRGVGSAVARAKCPRVYVPSLGQDPETLGLSVFDAARRIITTLERSAGERVDPSRLLNFVLVDSRNGAYAVPAELDRLERLGVQVIDTELVTARSAPLLDEERVIGQLMSLA